ncbi:MAG: nucleotidyl transferase AbiEii/AbiGii toxin family protein [Aphanocapsa sp. GSE-SYN-MK-11-07L]|jgi:hypothetical protein|nr:nucleotidyl transferase AbiEii/AbiGii toxin family protein [Aphanocapsa sp. GSE-SYN-MK-11-07L]
MQINYGKIGDIDSRKATMPLSIRKKIIELSRKRLAKGYGSGSSQAFLRQIQPRWNSIEMAVHDHILCAYVVTGGVATQLYMPSRQTEDIDILIRKADLKTLEANLETAGARLIEVLSPITDKLPLEGNSWQLPSGISLDVLFAEGQWVNEAVSQPVYSEQQPNIPFICLPYLVLMKLNSSRSQDIADVERMLGNKSDQDIAEVSQVMQSFYPEALDDLYSLIEIGRLEYRPRLEQERIYPNAQDMGL